MKNKRFWLGMLVLALALTLVACGDEEDGKTPFPTDGTLDEKLTWVSNGDNVEDGQTYTIEVTADETISRGYSFSSNFGSHSNITIVLKGIGAERKISSSGEGSILFFAGNNFTLVLDENITLQGKSDSRNALVSVEGGRLEMKEGAKITGNTNTDTTSFSGGGGVYVWRGGTFTMSGGEISGNTANMGGGVYVNNGTFTMSGGKISGNTAITRSDGLGSGGGVYVYSDGTFTKTGGTIYGYSVDDTVNSNVVKNSSGAVQSNKGHAVNAGSNGKHRETTAGSSDNLDSTKTGAEGGWAAED